MSPLELIPMNNTQNYNLVWKYHVIRIYKFYHIIHWNDGVVVTIFNKKNKILHYIHFNIPKLNKKSVLITLLRESKYENRFKNPYNYIKCSDKSNVSNV